MISALIPNDRRGPSQLLPFFASSLALAQLAFSIDTGKNVLLESTKISIMHVEYFLTNILLTLRVSFK